MIIFGFAQRRGGASRPLLPTRASEDLSAACVTRHPLPKCHEAGVLSQAPLEVDGDPRPNRAWASERLRLAIKLKPCGERRKRGTP